jgi:hypothetical protein
VTDALLATPPATLTLGGVPLRAREDPPASAARLVVACMSLDGRGRRRHHAAALVALLAALVAEDDADRLAGALSSRDRPPPLRLLGDAAAWLVEEATGRRWGQAWALSSWALTSWRRWRGRLLAAGVAEPVLLADLLDVAEAFAALDVAEAQTAAAMRAKPPSKAVGDAVAEAWRERESWGAAGDGGAGLMALVGAGKG